ncbi:MAG TPA: class I SAM-dependent methyltransferase [Acidobacteriaceae bacterium]|jgi:SAM-dependent methyltransferase
MIVREYWATTAEYYDSFHSNRREDVEFWTNVASRIGGPVLEIGCGTGRVALEIARSGIDVYGVDQSEAILDVFRRKLTREPEDVQRRVRLHLGDMRAFELGQQFSLALMPFRPLQHMLSLEEQIAAFQNARRHLKAGGILGFDVFFPNFSLFDEPDGVEKPEREWLDQEGRTIRRFFLRHRVDKVNQVIYASFIFRTYAGRELISEETSPLNMSYYTYPHLRLLLKLTHFEASEEYGSFALDPITKQQEMIILARAV